MPTITRTIDADATAREAASDPTAAGRRVAVPRYRATGRPPGTERAHRPAPLAGDPLRPAVRRQGRAARRPRPGGDARGPEGGRALRSRLRRHVRHLRGAHDRGRAAPSLPGHDLGRARPAPGQGPAAHGQGGGRRAGAGLGRSPTVAEIAGQAGVPEEDVLDALEAARCYRKTPLESGADDGTGELVDIAALGQDERGLDAVEATATIEQPPHRPAAGERRIVELRYVQAPRSHASPSWSASARCRCPASCGPSLAACALADRRRRHVCRLRATTWPPASSSPSPTAATGSCSTSCRSTARHRRHLPPRGCPSLGFSPSDDPASTSRW